MRLTTVELTAWVTSILWPFMRIGAMFVTVPFFAARTVPVKVRLVLSLSMAVILSPIIPPVPAVDILSASGILISLHQLLIGLAMGFILQLTFAVMAVAGQSIAMGMGLGFASMIDPQNGVQVPVLSSYFAIVATLLFLALDGHLSLIALLADSFRTLPIGLEGISGRELWQLVNWGGQMFAGAVLVALPALASLLTVNLAFGLITRSAPQLNIFGVGFPLILLLGIVILVLSINTLPPQFSQLLTDSYALLASLTKG